MIVAFAFVAILATWAMFRIAQDYVRRSIRSFRHAERVWAAAMAEARILMEADIPSSVSRLVIELSSLAGCGCFVRGMVVSHYFPRAIPSNDAPDATWDGAFADVEALPSQQRDQFRKMLALIVLYDSYRNPFQGWLFRRSLKAVIRPDPGFKVQMETQLTAYSVVSRHKSPMFHPLTARQVRVMEAA